MLSVLCDGDQEEAVMKALIQNILDLTKLKGASYADIRIVRRQFEEIEVKNGNVEALTHDEDFGFGIRVLSQGAWGFACSSKVTKREMESVFGKALKIARASSKAKGREVLLPPTPPVVDTYKTAISIDPFDVSPEEKLSLLLKADQVIQMNKKVKISEAFMGSYKTEKTFASTEGSYIEQEIVESGGGIAATAIEAGDIQVRSYPNSFRGNFATKGYEWIKELALEHHAEQVAKKLNSFFLQNPVHRRSRP